MRTKNLAFCTTVWSHHSKTVMLNCYVLHLIFNQHAVNSNSASHRVTNKKSFEIKEQIGIKNNFKKLMLILSHNTMH